MGLLTTTAISGNSPTELSSAARLLRGLNNASTAALDISRGSIGLGIHGAQTAVRKLAGSGKNLATEATDLAKSVTTNLTAELTQESLLGVAPKKKLIRRLLCGSILLAAIGGLTYAVVRTPSVPEPSPLPPTVNHSE